MKWGYIAAVDIGGTKMRGILWNGRRVVRSQEVKTPQDPSRFTRTLPALIARLSKQNNLKGVGIGAAGVISGTTLIFAPNMPRFRRIDFRKMFPSTTVKVDNDARCFARAETFVRHMQKKRVLTFTIGTGIGRGWWAKGSAQKLKSFEYPEPWERKYQRLKRSASDNALAAFVAEKLTPFVQRLRPDIVVVGGSVAHREKFWKAFKGHIKHETPALCVERARSSKNSGAIGAALLFRS
jgi:predicted NBD/HSP70 family sugar kinase